MRFHPTAALGALLLLAGCGHTPPREVIPAALPPHPAENQVTAERSRQLRETLAPCRIRGAAVFPAAVFRSETFSDAAVVKAIRQSGVNRLYCHLSSEQELNSRLEKFLAAAAEAEMPVEIVISQIDYYRRYQANQLLRWALIQFPDLAAAAEKVVKFNSGLPEKHRLAGIVVHIAPHIYDGRNARRMYSHLYRWQESRYGAGGDNDMLMREAFDQLRRIAALPELPPLTVAFPDFYHEQARAGKLSCGTVKDFAAIAPRLAVVSTANLPSAMAKNVADELADAPAGVRIISVVPLAHHTSVGVDRLRRRDWNDFIRAVKALIAASGADDNFAGVILSPFAVVEYLRLEK